mmetsp:Transcript_13906/g.44638  ORF Transcript_13906/g.44638 Transcript_13906/m.44638 type:complete len:372 (+) Transcript_13906:703-1818(+)
MQRLGAHALDVALDVLGDHLGVSLPIDEDDGVASARRARVAVALFLHRRLHLLDQVGGVDQLGAARVAEPHLLHDRLSGDKLFLPAHVDPDRVVEEVHGQLAHLRRPGRRKHEGLPNAICGQMADDLPQLRLEAHVEHPIRLIEDEVPHISRADRLVAQHVVEPAGRAHHQVQLSSEHQHLPLLQVLSHAPEHAGGAAAKGGGEGPRLLVDLLRQLARRRQHKRERATGGPVRLASGGGLPEEREQEAERLPRPRLRNRNHVAPRQRQRQRLRLDRARRVKPALVQKVGDGGGERLVDAADGAPQRRERRGRRRVHLTQIAGQSDAVLLRKAAGARGGGGGGVLGAVGETGGGAAERRARPMRVRQRGQRR